MEIRKGAYKSGYGLTKIQMDGMEESSLDEVGDINLLRELELAQQMMKWRKHSEKRLKQRHWRMRVWGFLKNGYTRCKRNRKNLMRLWKR